MQTHFRFDRVFDLFQDDIAATATDVVCDPPHMPAVFTKPNVTLAIMTFLFRVFVLRSIKFDDEFGGNTKEISDVRTNWYLSPEFPFQAAAA